MVKIIGRRSLVKNKKASALDLIFIAVAILIFGTSVLFGFKITSEFNSHIQSQAGIPTEAKETANSLQNNYTGILDNSILFLVIGLAIGSFILASMVRIHPIFIPLFFILLVFIIFFCAIYSNIYQGMAETAQLETEAAQLTTITYVLTYLPFIVGILGIILMIVMYKLYSTSEM